MIIMYVYTFQFSVFSFFTIKTIKTPSNQTIKTPSKPSKHHQNHQNTIKPNHQNTIKPNHQNTTKPSTFCVCVLFYPVTRKTAGRCTSKVVLFIMPQRDYLFIFVHYYLSLYIYFL